MGSVAKKKSVTRQQTVRCAIYTRKSSEEGLEQDFNSLDAQREACEAYIRSQRGEGWICLSTMYDDGGISGGTMERPALKQLLANIEAGSIDAVVVYKVDRLTRSLSDFARIVEVFDAQSVSFVSVTQQFNTTTSMGRLTLNMLLSFAQFERDVTGERIRDKIAASKRRGMWMGGLPPLGYDVRDRKLVINEAESKTVRHVFRRYSELGSVLALKTELDRDGVKSKSRLDKHGRAYGGHPIARGALYLMLQNQIYRGDIVHKDKSFPGEHAAIIDEPLWRNVQAKMADNRIKREIGTDVQNPSLLTGLVFDSTGQRMSPSHTKNTKGTRYRYYISQALIKGQRSKEPRALRVPAGELEHLVEQRILACLINSAEVLEIIESVMGDGAESIHTTHLIACAAELAQGWPKLAPQEKRCILLALIERVDVLSGSVEIHLRASALAPVLRLRPKAGSLVRGETSLLEVPSAQSEKHIITWKVPAHLKRTGMEKRLLIDISAKNLRRNPDHSLARLLAQAQQFQGMLMRAGTKTMAQLASDAGVTGSYFTRVLRLSFLAPEITKAILQNCHPIELTAKRLANERNLPNDWAAQRELLGIG